MLILFPPAGESENPASAAPAADRVILAEPDLEDWNEIEAAVLDLGLVLMPPLGFNNTYAIAVTRQTAERHGLRTISNLRRASDLRIALSHEFLNREDGWPGLKARYDIVQPVRGIEHSLAYEAMANGQPTEPMSTPPMGRSVVRISSFWRTTSAIFRCTAPPISGDAICRRRWRPSSAP